MTEEPNQQLNNEQVISSNFSNVEKVTEELSELVMYLTILS